MLVQAQHKGQKKRRPQHRSKCKIMIKILDELMIGGMSFREDGGKEEKNVLIARSVCPVQDSRALLWYEMMLNVVT